MHSVGFLLSVASVAGFICQLLLQKLARYLVHENFFFRLRADAWNFMTKLLRFAGGDVVHLFYGHFVLGGKHRSQFFLAMHRLFKFALNSLSRKL